MKDALVFGGANSLDFFDVRLGIIRIPEVSLKLQEAQKIWDRQCGASFSFHSFLTSEDHTFFNNINLKSLCLSIVQLGLLDRYCRLFRAPQYMVGNVQNDSALQVATGHQTLTQLIINSRAAQMSRPMSVLQPVPSMAPAAPVMGLTLLNGQTLPQYQTFFKSKAETGETFYAPAHEAEMKMVRAMERAIDEFNVSKIIHVGPGQLDKSIVEALEPRELQIVESIDIDPMLGWFWREMRNAAPARAHA